MPSPVTPWLEGFKCVQICMRVVFHQMKNGFPSLCAFSINSIVLLAAYRAPNENCGLVAVTFLGCFQTDNIHEVVQRLNNRSKSWVKAVIFSLGMDWSAAKGCRMAAVSG